MGLAAQAEYCSKTPHMTGMRLYTRKGLRGPGQFTGSLCRSLVSTPSSHQPLAPALHLQVRCLRYRHKRAMGGRSFVKPTQIKSEHLTKEAAERDLGDGRSCDCLIAHDPVKPRWWCRYSNCMAYRVESDSEVRPLLPERFESGSPSLIVLAPCLPQTVTHEALHESSSS